MRLTRARTGANDFGTFTDFRLSSGRVSSVTIGFLID